MVHSIRRCRGRRGRLLRPAPRYRFGRDRIPAAAEEMRHIADRLVDVLWQDAAFD
ncbi:hypothetical protein [Rhodococcus koreensis]|uniref:hypothetical protein n=1 Tax=Rhodococcus koreensis TaxID=99653 RepID=UPI00197F6814|nr:hypothetical protein [Rhodococcus koreensis]QSE82209.1 hypothetical protein JWS14_25115 [Rhodococcus koreensis]